MLILPVLDVLDGHVVHGVGGRRTEYRPIASRLTPSSDPLEIAKAIRETFGLRQFYLADLGGIIQQRPNLSLYRRLAADGFELLVDAGIRNPVDAKNIRDAGVTRLIVGLESCRSPDDLADIAATAGELIFSLDLLGGAPCRRVDANGWSHDPQAIVRQAIQANVNTILTLDLSDVGMGTGGSTDCLCRFIKDEFPGIDLITGGGIRDSEDLKRIVALRVDAVLVATALHDGRLTRNDVLAFI